MGRANDDLMSIQGLGESDSVRITYYKKLQEITSQFKTRRVMWVEKIQPVSRARVAASY